MAAKKTSRQRREQRKRQADRKAQLASPETQAWTALRTAREAIRAIERPIGALVALGIEIDRALANAPAIPQEA